MLRRSLQVLISAILVSCFYATPSESKELVIIDTDTTAFRPLTLDMEDDLAVLFSMASPEIEVKGLTITYGNGFQKQTYPDALKLKKLAGWDVPVLRGADYFDRDLDQMTESSRFIIETALSEPEGISILALGAMTNIAAAIRARPDIIPQINRIVMMGGNISSSNIDVNFAADPIASNILFNAPIPKVIVPTETCLQTVFTREQVKRVQDHPDSVVYQFRHRIQSYLALWTVAHDIFYPPSKYPTKVKGGFIPWDSISAAYMVRPELFSETRCFSVQMVEGKFTSMPCDDAGDFRGKTLVPMTLNREAFDELFMERVLSVKTVDRGVDLRSDF